MNRFFLISLEISIGKYKEFINNIIELAKGVKSSYVCVANVHMLVEAYKDKDFAAVVNNADIVTPDGMPLAMSISLFRKAKQDRVAGMSLLPDLLNACQEQGLSVYFYGGTQKMLDVTKEFCRQSYPGLEIAGLYSPPFRPLSADEESEIVTMINNTRSNIVFVALGCPKQEKWMASMKGKVNGCMVGIGGALPVMVGLQKRAPEWMRKSSLEWLFRLGQEPRRLFARYFTTNSLYMYLLSKEIMIRSLKNNK